MSYETINKSFEKAVVKLQENLQYLANQGKVSDQFISMQNKIIKALIDYQHQAEYLIEHLELDIIGLTKGKIKEIKQLEDTKEAFEALCIIHGIMDFPIWMNRGKKNLVRQAINDYRENTITLPSVLKDKLDSLPQEKNKVLNDILYHSYNEEIEVLEQQIKRTQSKIK